MTTTQSRIVGSGFTAIFFQGKVIALLDTFTDSGQRPITAPETVHVLGPLKRPTEIATSRVVDAGTLTVRLREAWGQEAWQYLITLAGGQPGRATNIAQAQEALDRLPGAGLTMSMVITPPGKARGRAKRGKTYHGLVITDLGDRETIGIGTLTVPKDVTFMYTHTTPYGR